MSRRTAIKAGAVSAAALALPSVPGARAASRPKAGGPKPSGPSAPVRADFQFEFGHVVGVSDLVLVASGNRVALSAHGRESRAALAREGGLWETADLESLSHFVEGVELPGEQASLVSVYGQMDGDEVLVGQTWHVPGLEGQERQRQSVIGPKSTAVSMTMLHPNIATKDTAAAKTTMTVLGHTDGVDTFAQQIKSMQASAKRIAVNEPALNADGSEAQIKIGDITTGFKTTTVSTSAEFRKAFKAAVTSGVGAVRDTASLGAVIDKPLDQDKTAAPGSTWVQPQGQLAKATVVDEPAMSRFARRVGSGQFVVDATAAQVEVEVKTAGDLFGTKTEIVTHELGEDRKINLTIYNNYVRWVSVYVQYLGQNGDNLSLDEGASPPNTKYAKWVGFLPQVFTILGAPLWDTNTIEVQLEFPPAAHTARLLFCGLGSDINDPGWRQYFPDGAYADKIAPQDEVLVASLLTAFLCIGVTMFSLAADIDAAASWSTFKNSYKPLQNAIQARKTVPFGTALDDANKVYQDLLQTVTRAQGIGLRATEAAAASVAAGAATYEEVVGNGGDLRNLWSILTAWATVLPKVIFSPRFLNDFFTAVAGAVGLALPEKVIDAIPLFGQVMAAVEIAGDVATLAEVCAETIVCPWVIENEVSLTYEATVTISHDPSDASFPETARSWRLEAMSNGKPVLDPVVGPVNQHGAAQSEVVVKVKAPFGGTIQWSVVFLTASGFQVGAGVSDVLENDDPTNPPSEVAITIQEIAVPITSSTVFERQVTTAFDRSVDGYVWSDLVTEGATVQSSQTEVVGVTVATALGVAGVVFKGSDNLFYVRGVPTVQNPGETIRLGTGTTEKFARRPFLLFDTFAPSADAGGHVLLDPDPDGGGYHVRALKLDPVTGELSWDGEQSLGMFPLDVSAAAMHSSGRVVALHTDFGRVGWLNPVDTRPPSHAANEIQISPLANYSAGNGTQIGLLSSPIAVAITNPGSC